MISDVVHFATQNPDDAVAEARRMAGSMGRITGHALGMTAEEVQSVASRGLSTPVVALVCFSVGALIAMRYAPDPWISKVKRFGR